MSEDNLQNDTEDEPTRAWRLDELIAYWICKAAAVTQLERKVEELEEEVKKQSEHINNLNNRGRALFKRFKQESKELEISKSKEFKPNRGRKPKTVEKHRKAVLEMLEQGKTQTEIAKTLHIGRDTVRKIQREQDNI